ncbi:hypothetical protein MPRM_00080 [Mycobacterium parmense]|uniref:Alpha/beta-hydrolase N-terminal domain-containing protein n=1 Tax=Mycobacterium parmense TaxID=185642 RepID=A0A7I7YN28_9MYCO|nr:hypothetical protein MPRM_00080 [Mycobacterium parmense]
MVAGGAGRGQRGRRGSVFRPGRRRLEFLERRFATDATYETIIVERDHRVGIITLNWPNALNALNSQMMNEVTCAATELDNESDIGAIVITGSAKAFAAGADIKEMAGLSFADAFGADFCPWAKLAVRTPTIAAVAGHALGGGCELAMMCDLLIAADTAKFGQPEIKLGVLPGMGGSQRLTRAIGKAKAMDLILTGRTIDAAEAERSGLVSRVVPADDLISEAMAVATTISQMSRSAARMAKEAVNRAFESTLAEGLLYERRLFHSALRPRTNPRAWRRSSSALPTSPTGRTPGMDEPGSATDTDAEPHAGRTAEPATAPQAANAPEGAGPPATAKPWWVRHYTFTGTAGGLVFVWFSMTPSLPPRAALFQGLVSGISGAIGYGIGVFSVWLVRYMLGWSSSPPAPRWAWKVLIPVGAVGMVVMAIRFHVAGRRARPDGRRPPEVVRPSAGRGLVARHPVHPGRDRPVHPLAGALPGR